MIRYFIFISMIIMLLSCFDKKTPPDSILKPDKMQVVLWDIVLAETFSSHFITATGYIENTAVEDAKFQKQIFAIDGVSRDEFYGSFNYYKSNSVLMKVLLDSLTNKALREKNAAVSFNPELSK